VGAVAKAGSEIVRVLVVDDQPIFAQALRALLEANPRIDVVGEADTGAYALELADALEPDVVLVDVLMPGWDGLEITRRLRTDHPRLRVVVVSGVSGSAVARDALAAGADAFLLKGNLQDEVAEAILAAADGTSSL
jgi:DNA-binding NarL/FixJ family response regulator